MYVVNLKNRIREMSSCIIYNHAVTNLASRFNWVGGGDNLKKMTYNCDLK